MNINVKYIPTEYVPVWYYTPRATSIWDWLTPEDAHVFWFRQEMEKRFGKGWENEDE